MDIKKLKIIFTSSLILYILTYLIGYFSYQPSRVTTMPPVWSISNTIIAVILFYTLFLLIYKKTESTLSAILSMIMGGILITMSYFFMWDSVACKGAGSSSLCSLVSAAATLLLIFIFAFSIIVYSVILAFSKLKK